MKKTGILDDMFDLKGSEIGKLEKRDKEILEYLEASLDVDVVFPDIKGELKERIREFSEEIKEKITTYLSTFDSKYYKARLF